MKTILGSVLALIGLSICMLHLLVLGEPPHMLWTIFGLAILIAGMWLVIMAPMEKKGMR